MKQENTTCPQCHGFKIILDFKGTRLGKCDMCEGSGLTPESVARWHAYGKRLRYERLFRRMTLRDAAKFLKMDASNLSKMERGMIAPRNLWSTK